MLNLGQATKFAFSKKETEWVVVIDLDLILRKGWFKDIERCSDEADAIEGCEIRHYRFDVLIQCTKLMYGRFNNILLKREPVLNMDLDLPFGEDAAVRKKS